MLDRLLTKVATLARLGHSSSRLDQGKRYVALAVGIIAVSGLLLVAYQLLAMFRDGSLQAEVTSFLAGARLLKVPIRETGLLVSSAAVALVLVAVAWLSTRAFGSPVFYVSTYLGLLLVLTLVAGPFGHDVDHHLSRLDEVARAIPTGQFPLYMSNVIAGGKGLPVFVFYPSSIYLVPAVFALLGFSLLTSIKLAAGLLLVAATIAMYAALRSFVPPRQAQIGAFLYVTSNYVLGDMYARFAFAECYALIFLPLALRYTHRWVTQRNLRSGIVLVAVVALLFVVHPPTGVNSLLGLSLFAVGYSALYVRDLRAVRGLLAGGALMALSFMTLTAFYWVPVALEGPYVYLNEGLPTAYWQQFRSWGDYGAFFDFRTPGYALLVALVWALASTFALRTRSSGASAMAWSLVAPPLVYMFLVSPASRPLWDRVPMLQANVFPWRLLLPVTVFASVLVCLRFVEHDVPNELTASVLSVFLFVQGLSVAVGFLADPIRSGPGDMKSRLAQYAAREDGWGVHEYLPRVPNDRTVVVKPPDIVGDVSILRRERQGNVDRLTIEPIALAGHYRIDLYWHVRYRVYVDGKETELYVDDKGRAIVLLEPGQSTVVVVYTAPLYVVWSERASMATLITLGGLYCLRGRGSKRESKRGLG